MKTIVGYRYDQFFKQSGYIKHTHTQLPLALLLKKLALKLEKWSGVV